MTRLASVPLPRPQRPRRRAFTLIEMLVVMAVIGILAGMFFPIHGALRSRAFGVKSHDLAQQASRAWLFYFQEYRQFPLQELNALPDVSQDNGDHQFPMTAEAARLVEAYFEASDIQKKVGILSAWGDRKARIASRQAGGPASLDPGGFAADRIWVKLDTNYDGEIRWNTTPLKKSVLAWSPGETPDRPVIKAW